METIKKKKRASVMRRSVGDLVAITFHIPPKKTPLPWETALFCKHTNAAAAADAHLNIYEPVG